MQLTWYVTAIGAALVWGVHYPLVAHALKKISLVSMLLLTALPVVLVAPFFTGPLPLISQCEKRWTRV